jgi:hypothetical protein
MMPCSLPCAGDSHAFFIDIGDPISGEVGAVDCVNIVVLSADSIEHDPSLVVVAVDWREVYGGLGPIAGSACKFNQYETAKG